MKDFLQAYDLDTVDGFSRFVIENILDNIDDNPKYVEDIIQYGCSSGIVTDLTYYHQTDKVFRDYFNEILEIYDTCIEQNLIRSDFEVNANNLVWLIFEYICNTLYTEYEVLQDEIY